MTQLQNRKKLYAAALSLVVDILIASGSEYGVLEYRSMVNWLTEIFFDILKSGIFDQPELKVHLGQAWRIEFSYRNIRES